MTGSTAPDRAYIDTLKRHFGDLRDGTHGGARQRGEKEELFEAAAKLLDPHARMVLTELDHGMLLDSGRVEANGPRRTSDGGMAATWALTWPEQQKAGIRPVSLIAHYGAGFHHPHLRGATVSEWPLNVFTDEQARGEIPMMRAIAAGDLHNLVFQRDYRIVPAIVGDV
ncbi:hypothetical protein [Streptomonospora salina]|uniref:Uncharacterized protein n=1 Tax=Streptomonospora salina TaxID=104205 RepID=A0A841E5Z9_9ACTN|nr:hypothetical protein [Streptomonospora salina]MBB5998575.1 hypothetical protein [Streptomonospora salina]